MNTSSSKKERPYLEDVTASVEYKFATANAQLTMSNDRITYFDAFNQVGEKIFKTAWTGREFFAGRSNTDVAEYQANNKLSYSLFSSQGDQAESASRACWAQDSILMALRAGEFEAYYTNHYTGEETLLKPSFWKSTKSSFATDRGRYKAPDRNKRPAVPGIDFIVVLDFSGFETLLKKLDRLLNKKRVMSPPSNESIREANKLIVTFCKEQKFLMNREMYYAALNKILNTEHFKDSNSRHDWDTAVPELIKNRPGYSNPNPLPLNKLPKLH